jgi:hypothetical protein
MKIRQARKLDPARIERRANKKKKRRKSRGTGKSTSLSALRGSASTFDLVKTRRIGTLRTAAARLRSSWRAACPMETDADGRQHRKTGTQLPHPDWWAGNRLAILAWRLKWYRQPGGFKSPPPPHDHHSEIHGQRRKAQ